LWSYPLLRLFLQSSQVRILHLEVKDGILGNFFTIFLLKTAIALKCTLKGSPQKLKHLK